MSKLCGIGVVVDLGRNNSHNQNPLIIQSVVPGGAAAKKGPAALAAGDEILLLDGKNPSTLSVAQLQACMIGEAGTTLSMKRKRGDQIIDLVLTREPIQEAALHSVLPGTAEPATSNLIRVDSSRRPSSTPQPAAVAAAAPPPPAPRPVSTPAPAAPAPPPPQKSAPFPPLPPSNSLYNADELKRVEIPHMKGDDFSENGDENKQEGWLDSILNAFKQNAVVCCSQRP